MEKVNNFRENLHETIKIQHKKESKRTDDISMFYSTYTNLTHGTIHEFLDAD